MYFDLLLNANAALMKWTLKILPSIKKLYTIKSNFITFLTTKTIVLALNNIVLTKTSTKNTCRIK